MSSTKMTAPFSTNGLVLILKELHDRLDVAVAEAYGWPSALTDYEILTKLVALNKERSAEEKRGLVRWLRPDYQIPRFAQGVDKQAAKEEGAQVAAELVAAVEQKPSFPSGAVRADRCDIRGLGRRQRSPRCQGSRRAVQANENH